MNLGSECSKPRDSTFAKANFDKNQARKQGSDRQIASRTCKPNMQAEHVSRKRWSNEVSAKRPSAYLSLTMMPIPTGGLILQSAINLVQLSTHPMTEPTHWMRLHRLQTWSPNMASKHDDDGWMDRMRSYSLIGQVAGMHS